MKNKKSQAALEFLTTYGWAILVVTIMIGALAYFGVINPKSVVKEQCITSGYPFECVDYSLMDSGTTGKYFLYVYLKNLGKDTINISTNLVEENCFDEELNLGVSYEIESPYNASLSSGDITVVKCLFDYGKKIKRGELKKYKLNVKYVIDKGNLTTSGPLEHIQEFNIIVRRT